MKYLSLLLFCGVLYSCQPGKKPAEEKDLSALKDEVMAIHDEVMPKMGDLRKAKKALMALADSIVAVDSVKAAEFMKVANELNEANEGMMVWMRQYEPQLEGAEDSLWNYYMEQKAAIQKVSEAMNGKLEEGQQLLSQ